MFLEEIIRPLELDGILVHRSRDQLEKDLPNCYVLSRDGTTLACGMLKPYSESQVKHGNNFEFPHLSALKFYRRKYAVWRCILNSEKTVEAKLFW